MNGVTSAMVPNSTTPITTMNTTPETKLRSLNMSNRTNGSSVVNECAKKYQKPNAAMIVSTQISRAPNQPTSSPRSSISCSEPMPTASAMKPNQSNRRCVCTLVSCMKTIRPSEVMTPIGRLIRNTQCQE